MQYLELIERRYTGQMTSVEIADFEKLLKTNSALASEWADFNAIANAMSAQASNNLRQEVAASRKELEQEGFFDEIEAQIEAELAAEAAAAKAVATPVPAIKVVKNNLWRRWAVAAGLVGLVVAGWLINERIQHNGLMAEIGRHQQNYKEYSPITMGEGMTGDSTGDSITIRIRTLLEQGQPDSALAVITALDGKEESDIYYEGVAYFQKGNYDKAIYILNDLVMQPTYGQMAVKWQAQWFLAICYHLTDQDHAADRTLRSLLEEDPDRTDKAEIREKARKMLKSIR